ncbi:MAG: flagellar export chaperone FliS [Rhodoferax sp.]|nr:flagellar export chaperone FliS [Rhodoferax sp.]MBP8285956.1 flagellar export chaperone FliS [Rhodoferax sp.]MBP9059416.1 flagellar export chaperone FliS [Rhodoferax sp.]MBP9684811.1 flagellar export chaperone FliS [Rhodoferax sp.]
MLTLVSSRTSAAYKQACIETGVDTADPHGLICLLLDALHQAVSASRLAMDNGDIPKKCRQIRIAMRILDEGLNEVLNLRDGGELALNLRNLYNYCYNRLLVANIYNDASALGEVDRLMTPISTSWKQINQPGPAYLRVV